MNPNPLRQRATRLRDLGYSYNYINEKIGVSKSTLSNWFSSVPFTPNKKTLDRIKYGPIKVAKRRHNERVEETAELKNIGAKEVGRLSKRDLWFLGIGIYIGEGSKTYEHIRIVNADPTVIKIAMRWFRKVCNMKDENFKITLHLYPDNNAKQCLRYWSKVTDLGKEHFRKNTIDTRLNKSIVKRHKLPYGTAHLQIVSCGNSKFGVKLHRRIMGWIHGALNNPIESRV